MANKTKVVEFVTTMADGGAETLIKDYALLCDETIDMRIVVWSEPLGTANERILSEAGIDVLHLGAANAERPTSNPFVKAYRKIRKFTDFRNYIIREEIDTIHVHLRFGRFFRVLPSKVLKRLNLIYTLHNEPEKYFDPNGNSRQKLEYKEAKRLIDKYNLTMVVLHEEMNQKVRNLFGIDRVITINNGINFERFDASLYDRNAIREQLGIPVNAKLIGHVGSFTPQKNHEYLLKIFQEYLKKDESAKLLLVGRGVLKQKTLQTIRDMKLENSIVVLENRSDIPELMSTMDVFVLPSRWEGFPVVLIEAQRIGLPCVISDKINRDVVLTERVCMKSIDGPAEKWVDAIDGLEKAEEISGRFDDYDIRKSIERLQELYKA